MYVIQISLQNKEHHRLFQHQHANCPGDIKHTTTTFQLPMQKLAVEITYDGVVDEPFRCLGLSMTLHVKYNIIIILPPTTNTCI